MFKEIDKRIKRHMAGIRQSFRGVINLVNAAGKIQLVQLQGLAGEQLQDAELFQQYGLRTIAPAGTMAIVVPIGGKTAHGIVVATEHPDAGLVGMLPGESALYTIFGDKIVIHADGTIEVQSSNKVQVTSPLMTLSGDLTVQGSVTVQHDITAQGEIKDAGGTKSMSGMRNTFNNHKHPETGTVTGTTPTTM